MATDWSEAAKAKRSASAKKAAETRKANQAAKADISAGAELGKRIGRKIKRTTYIQNSRVARWALSGVSVLAMMRRDPIRVAGMRPNYMFNL